ncbi:site-specific integrase, partial [Parabacteroides sp. D13]
SLFKGVFTGVESQRKKSLPLGDLNRLMTVPVKGEKLRKTQLALCLMFQYGGMSFVDFAHLNRGNIKNGILDYNRQKTGTSMRLEVLDTAEAMYKELAGERAGGSGYLFPFLSGTKNGHEEYLEYNAALSRFNRNLKTLKEVAGIVSDVTSYTIRHSFAMALKEQNVPIEMISELLGHKSIKTTQIYLRSFSLEKMTVVNKSCFENVYNYMPEVG